MDLKLSARSIPRLISSGSESVSRPRAGSHPEGLTGPLSSLQNRTLSCKHDTCRAISRNDRPPALSWRAIRRCSFVNFGAIQGLLGSVNQPSLTNRVFARTV